MALNPRKPDPISDALGTYECLEPWYPDDLRIAIHGPLRKEHVRLSRYYFKLDPKVVVDFEPDPRDERWYIDEKRRWCMEEGLIYVPIYMADELTTEAFARRVDESREMLKQGLAALLAREERERLGGEHQMFTEPDVLRWVEQEAERRVAAGEVEQQKRLYGFMRNRAVKKARADVRRELLERYPDGRVGTECRASVSPDAARG